MYTRFIRWVNYIGIKKQALQLLHPKLAKRSSKPSSQNNGSKPTDLDSLIAYTKNWPAESVDTLKANLEAGQPFKIAILGSSALGEGEESWPEIVKASLNDAFAQNVTVSTLTYDLTSLEFVNEDKVTEVIEEQPDLVLFEPFTLKDNGLVTIDDSLENASSTIAEIKESLPETRCPNPTATPIVSSHLLSGSS